jgi:hypothetical protein
MAVIMGSGEYTYELQEGWGTLPDGDDWDLKDSAAVAVDAKDNVYVFNRGPHPMVVFDRHGNFLRSWGEDFLKKAHGLHIAEDGLIYCTDEGDDAIKVCTPEGKIVLQIGVPGRRAPYMSGEPFHRCTHTALSPTGDIFVSDGYGNAKVHKYSPDGKPLMSWGEPGSDPGQFNLVHNVCCDPDGWVYVADRENHRVQIFDVNGKYETQWNNLHRPSALHLAPGKCPICFIGEIGPAMPVNIRTPNLGARISVVTHEGKPLGRIGARTPGYEPGQFMSPHGLAMDSHGDLYVGEVGVTAWPRLHPDEPAPRRLRTLQKLKRVKA